MILPSLLPFRKRRRPPRGAPATPTPPVEPLVLVAASFDADAMVLNVTFDRAVDVDAAVPGGFVVAYAPFSYYGVAASHGAVPEQVSVQMAQGDPYGGDNTFTVSSDNGLRAVDDGGTWAGISDAALPWPPPEPPALVSASYDETLQQLHLQFDRAILLDGVNTAAFSIDDVNTGYTYRGYSDPTAEGDTGAMIVMYGLIPYAGDEFTMSAAGDNGIRAQDGDEPWAGVAGWEL